MKLQDSIDLVFFALALIYAVVAALALLRVVKVHQFKPQWRQAKVFYVTVLAETFIRLAFFLAIFVNSSPLDEKLLFGMLTAPESLFLLTYFLLVWQYLEVYYYAHIESNSTEQLLEDTKPKLYKTHFCMLISAVWLVLQTVLYIVYCAGGLSDLDVSLELGILNILLPMIAFMVMAAMQFKFSGKPVISDEWRKRVNRISTVTVIWSAMRLFRGGVAIAESVLDYSLAQEISSNNGVSMTWFSLTISNLMFCEVVCFFLVIDYSFLCIFIFNEEASKPKEDQLLHSIRPKFDPEASFAPRFSLVTDDRRVTDADIEILEELPARKHQLGRTYRAVFRAKQVFYRKLEFARFNNYVMEELSQEIDKLPQHDCDFLVPIIGVVINPRNLGIVTPMMTNGSLYDALHVSKHPFSFQEKLVIMRDVVRCMAQLHSSAMLHGHLSSHNVLLDEQWHGYVTDYGLAKVKKYAGVALSYRNKNAWSSPEQLRERSMTTLKVTPYDDIYSFGVILWEILTETIPFEGYSHKDLSRKVGQENFRPQITDAVPEYLSDLVKSCWNTEPRSRPDFNLVLQTLTERTKH